MDLVPKPNSSFVKIKCNECGEEMIVFNHAKTVIVCNGKKCEEILVEPTGGKALINAEIVEALPN